MSGRSGNKDILDWLKDFGNAFNKAASKPSCIEHVLSLSKIEPAAQQHLQSMVPKVTSSHRDYEKIMKSFLDSTFPGRFTSFREFQSASAFRNRMADHALWESFIAFANSRMDFQKAGDLDNGQIYRTWNLVARKLLAFAPKTSKEGEYTWADLAMSVLKFAIPCAPADAQSSSQWTIPFSLAKNGDLEKIEMFLTPMNNSRAAKLPQTLKEEREKAAAKSAGKKKKGGSGKAAKAKAKAGTGKRGADEAVDIEEFHEEMTDALGNSRLTLLGDDILNAISYTLEKVDPKHHKKASISEAFDLAALFVLEGNLDAAGAVVGPQKITSWTKARQLIKSRLNRVHSLAARVSDPDLMMQTLEGKLVPSEEAVAEESQKEADLEKCFVKLAHVLKNVNDKAFNSFMENNFGDLTGDFTGEGR